MLIVIVGITYMYKMGRKLSRRYFVHDFKFRKPATLSDDDGKLRVRRKGEESFQRRQWSREGICCFAGHVASKGYTCLTKIKIQNQSQLKKWLRRDIVKPKYANPRKRFGRNTQYKPKNGL